MRTRGFGSTRSGRKRTSMLLAVLLIVASLGIAAPVGATGELGLSISGPGTVQVGTPVAYVISVADPGFEGPIRLTLSNLNARYVVGTDKTMSCEVWLVDGSAEVWLDFERPGQVDIIATDPVSLQSSSFDVQIDVGAPEWIQLFPYDAMAVQGIEQRFCARVVDRMDNVITGIPLTWNLYPEPGSAYATIDNGVFLAHGPGNWTIEVQADIGEEDPLVVTGYVYGLERVDLLVTPQFVDPAAPVPVTITALDYSTGIAAPVPEGTLINVGQWPVVHSFYADATGSVTFVPPPGEPGVMPVSVYLPGSKPVVDYIVMAPPGFGAVRVNLHLDFMVTTEMYGTLNIWTDPAYHVSRDVDHEWHNLVFVAPAGSGQVVLRTPPFAWHPMGFYGRPVQVIPGVITPVDVYQCETTAYVAVPTKDQMPMSKTLVTFEDPAFMSPFKRPHHPSWDYGIGPWEEPVFLSVDAGLPRPFRFGVSGYDQQATQYAFIRELVTGGGIPGAIGSLDLNPNGLPLVPLGVQVMHNDVGRKGEAYFGNGGLGLRVQSEEWGGTALVSPDHYWLLEASLTLTDEGQNEWMYQFGYMPGTVDFYAGELQQLVLDVSYDSIELHTNGSTFPAGSMMPYKLVIWGAEGQVLKGGGLHGWPGQMPLTVSLYEGTEPSGTPVLWTQPALEWLDPLMLPGMPGEYLLVATIDTGPYAGVLSASLPITVTGQHIPGPLAVVRAVPSTPSVAVGNEFSVDIMLDNVEGLYGFQVDMPFPVGIVSGIEIIPGDVLADGETVISQIDDVAGVVSLARTLIGAANTYTGSGRLLTVRFAALAPGVAHFDLMAPPQVEPFVKLAQDPEVSQDPILYATVPAYVNITSGVTGHIQVRRQGKQTPDYIPMVTAIDAGGGRFPLSVDAYTGMRDASYLVDGPYVIEAESQGYLRQLAAVEVISGVPQASLDMVLPFGDINQNDVIDLADLMMLAMNYGSYYYPQGDYNEDMIIDIYDLVALARNMGLVTPNLGPGSALVVVQDTTGAYVEGATVTLTPVATGAIVTESTDYYGMATFDAIPPGYYDLVVTAGGYVTSSRPIFVRSLRHVYDTVVVAPILLEGTMRIILTWGESPRDLDSHLIVPGGFQVYYANRGTLTAYPHAQLDYDHTNGFGPETVTIVPADSEGPSLLEGTYSYYVFNYTKYAQGQATEIPASGAAVQVYMPDGSTHSFTPPAAGTSLWWHVFDLELDAADNVVITEINSMGVGPGTGYWPHSVSMPPKP